MRILRKTILYAFQVYLGSIVVIGMILGMSWDAFNFGFKGCSSDLADKLAEWKEE